MSDELKIPDDLKELCSHMLAPKGIGGGILEAQDFWPLIERIAKLEALVGDMLQHMIPSAGCKKCTDILRRADNLLTPPAGALIDARARKEKKQL